MPRQDRIPATPFYRLGGHATFQAITDRFYDLMESEPEFAELRAMHAADLGPMRESLPLFLAGWAGGPRDWFEANPGRCIMSVHKPFEMNKAVAAQWADAMTCAIADVDPQPPELASAMSGILADLARGMSSD
ncbi:group II truncated hemoglobin [Novosphingobium aquimarinum]|uniref:group II truncated hemoglobin n=1 Tax=Novosphingobium aquimarinum TaxID=2682494 RepID=UPI0012EBF776|nr:group II truncated hemoglobin [Novosphingobium aquimarinum]